MPLRLSASTFDEVVAFIIVPASVKVQAPVIAGATLIAKVVPVPVCDAIEVALPLEVIGPVRFALVVTVPAVNPAAVPVMFVPTSALGVPRAGVTRVGLVLITTFPVPVMALDTRFLLASVNTAWEAVKPLKLIVPLALRPARVPTDVKLLDTTVLLRVVPESVPAGAITALPEAEVTSPLLLKVKVGMEVEEPTVAPVATVASVAAADPGPEAVTSPVRAVM